MAEIEYLHGDYDQVEAYYNSLMTDPDYQLRAEAGLLLVYYQRNEFAKAASISPEADPLCLRDMMMAFGDTEPYQVEWDGAQESITPFTVLDPLPVIPTEVNGTRIDALIDTGAAEFFINEALAKELGITPVSEVEGIGGGGTQAVSYGIAESISLNGITIKNVPVIIMPISHFSADFDDSIEINGILGVKLMQQFLTVMDYQQQQLELRPRTEENVNALKSEIAAAEHAEIIPMQFASDHYLLSKLTVNDAHSLNFFFDSGLSSEDDRADQILLPEGTLTYLGMPVPETDQTSEIGGLGGAFTFGNFTVDSIAAGQFRHEKVNGAYGIFPEPLYYDMCQLFVDGLVSHNFFREYRWSIDFDSMEMAFAR